MTKEGIYIFLQNPVVLYSFMKLSIIIVSWNTRELTLKCLRSIFDYVREINFNVFLVDNNSSDGTAAAVERLKKENNWSNLEIMANQENRGFAAANNQAIRQAEGEYILLLNPDTEFIKMTRSLDSVRDGLQSAIKFMKQNPQCGILGPKLLNTDGSLQKSCRRFPKLLDQIFVQLKFYNLLPEKIRAVREYFMLDFKHDEIRVVDQVMGAAMLIKKEVFDKIGLLDENFWAVFEEVDFCQRAQEAGYQTYFFPDWQIIHHKEQSFKKVAGLRKQMNFNKSLYHYFSKHKPFWQLFVLWLFQPLNLFLTWVDSVLKIRKILGKRKDL